MVGTADIVQDVVQEAWLQAFLDLQDLKDDEKIRGWLYGIVLNLAKNFIRRQARRRRLEVDFNEESPSDPAKNPQQFTEECELHRLAMEAIEGLPQTLHETTLLYYYEPLTVQEVSAITGSSVEAVRFACAVLAAGYAQHWAALH